MNKLTTEEQILVTENHNLIYGFCMSKNLSIEDYYGILAIGLCKAASGFDSSKAKFSTHAYNVMNNELLNHYANMETKGRIPEKLIVSYDKENSASSDIEYESTYLDSIADESIDMDFPIVLEEYYNLLSDKEQMTVQMAIEGRTMREVADILGCTVGYVAKIKKQLQTKWNKMNERSKI